MDKSLFEHSGTTVPEWACRMWGLQDIYGRVTSKTDSETAILFFKAASFGCKRSNCSVDRPIAAFL